MWNLLKVNSGDFVSFLTLLKCFLVYYEHVFPWCFYFYNIFFDVFIVNLKKTSPLDLLYLFSDLNMC